MNTEILAATPMYCVVPDWLQECLNIRDTEASNGTYSADNNLICSAFEFAYKLHEGQYRKSGEPYICHPIAVAGLLRYLGGSSEMVAAGFLHDIVEDTDVTPEQLEKKFGSEVSQLVEGVTKLSKLNFSSKTERQAENFRRMFLAMAKDIRVIIVKLADRLHNMRTLEHLTPEKQRIIAQETREIFAPLANRLGIGRFKWELEDLAFKYLEQEAYREMQELVAQKRADREAQLAEVTDRLRERLEKAKVKCYEVIGRPKHLFGIYQKMQRRQKGFNQVYDIAAVRIIVESNQDCYRSLAIVHDSFRPIPGRFKDYICFTKTNRYQSLHTGVIGPNGKPIEVQIRTVEMHHIAEYGIAAHWKYKETGNSHVTVSADDEKFTWLRQLLEWQTDLNAKEYLQSIKDNLFDEDIYVFTPTGDVISLNKGATPVDFAYRIHTEIGNHCIGSRINGRMVTLDTPLQNGDIVEIINQKNGHPSLDWLNFVVTSSAKHRIRQWFKRSHRDENLARGKEMLEKELGKSGFDALLKSEPMHTVALKCNYHSVNDLLAGLGYGELTINNVVNRLRDLIKTEQKIETAPTLPTVPPPRSLSTPSSSKSPIIGVEGLLYHLAGCCNAIPGEPIIGVVTRTRGISIHRQGCQNLENVEGERIVPVSWNIPDQKDGRPQTYPISIQIEVIDRVGVFNDILGHLKDHNVNVRSANVKTFPGEPALIDLCIEVKDKDQLEKTFVQIKKMGDVLNLRRLSQVN
jgi:guanosine-3',5'-bis(diphosphate) 3'-pyrophosphohydrolase